MSFLGPTIRPRSTPVSIRISEVTTCLTGRVCARGCAGATHVANPAQRNSAQIQRMPTEGIVAPCSSHCAAVGRQHLPHELAPVCPLPPISRIGEGSHC